MEKEKCREWEFGKGGVWKNFMSCYEARVIWELMSVFLRVFYNIMMRV